MKVLELIIYYCIKQKERYKNITRTILNADGGLLN